MSEKIAGLADEGQSSPRFLPQMKKTHTILVPQMLPIHFEMIMGIMRNEGYDIHTLNNSGPAVIQEGLQYVHNDACYPALLVIGQFIDALKHGGYDPDRTALLITQTGGGCRASNYIHLLRKALVRAGFAQVPVASLNFSNLERDSGLSLTVGLLLKALAGCFMGDMLMALSNQIRPYEVNAGETDAMVRTWVDRIVTRLCQGKGTSRQNMRRIFHEIAEDFTGIKRQPKDTYKVGIVGEIYVKYSPLGNNQLEHFLANEGCEVNIPGLMGFIQYCIVNYSLTSRLYGGNTVIRGIIDVLSRFVQGRERLMLDVVASYPSLRPMGSFTETMEFSKKFIGLGAKMGEGWLLTGEMAELVVAGYPNIICAQPFGCLPNHVVGRGMISKIRDAYPSANITSIDYDPSATRVNQENRIKLMLASAEKTRSFA